MYKPKEVVSEFGSLCSNATRLQQRVKQQLLGISERLVDYAAPMIWQQGPTLLSFVQQQLPAALRTAALQKLLDHFFAARALNGELDFLQGHRVQIEVTGTRGASTSQTVQQHPVHAGATAELSTTQTRQPQILCAYSVSLTAQRRLLVQAVDIHDRPSKAPVADVSQVLFRADASALLALVTQQADADTLFFRRKLLVSGDTETGLHLKNYLDQISVEPMLPLAIMKLAERLLAHAP